MIGEINIYQNGVKKINRAALLVCIKVTLEIETLTIFSNYFSADVKRNVCAVIIV